MSKVRLSHSHLDVLWGLIERDTHTYNLNITWLTILIEKHTFTGQSVNSTC